MSKNEAIIIAAVEKAVESMKPVVLCFPGVDVTLTPKAADAKLLGHSVGPVILDEVHRMPIEHLCWDGTIKDGSREKCCLAQWKAAGG